jgi:tetratricopeptide (TPR) repeat protein
MKKFLLALSLGCAAFTASAQQLRTPAPSSTQTIKQELGLGSVELSYSRPNIKGRKVFGDLVPFGKVWRTGANGATTLSFTDTVVIGGTKIPAGKYGLLSIPDKDSWTLIITKQLDVTSPAAYKQTEDLVRVKAAPMIMKDALETFTMQFGNVKASSTDLFLLWENTAVSLPITTDVDSKVTAQIKSLMENDNRPYFSAAMYYMDNGKDLNQALVWFNKAAEQDPSAFWVLHQKANCLAKLGKKEEAKATALKSIEAAKTAKNDDYVALNEKLLAKLK